jgi:hypothetical protein
MHMCCKTAQDYACVPTSGLQHVREVWQEADMYPSTSFVIARDYDLLLLYGEWECLEVWLLTLENASVETVLIGGV